MFEAQELLDRVDRLERAAFIPDTDEFCCSKCVEFYFPVNDVLQQLLEHLGFELKVQPAKERKILVRKKKNHTHPQGEQ